MASLNFDANTVEPHKAFDPIPAGKYLAAITESEEKPTKNGNGQYLQLTFQILEGEFKGRNLWARLNLKNPNVQAVEIARSELSAICRAVGVMTPKDSSDLHDLPVTLKVKVVRRSDTGEPTNEIAGYEGKTATSGVPQQAATSTPPWKR